MAMMTCLVRVSLLFAALVMLVSASSAQSIGKRSGLTLQGGPEQTGAAVAKDALGRPCLDVEAAARRGTVNPMMLDHVVSIKNNCPRAIKVKVCYFNSDRCNEIALHPYGRVDTILGTMKGINFFRYTITQK